MDWQHLLSKRRLGKPSTAEPGTRSEFQRDFDRIVFSTAFRRLQSKTQVFPLPETDFIHTRLTHSLEAACVGRSLGQIAGQDIVNADPDAFAAMDIRPEDFGAVVSAASLAHDIGNPPFGHSGEDAISEYFLSPEAEPFIDGLNAIQVADLQRYEGNAAGFRLLAYTLPTQSTLAGGLRLTHATLGAFTKYPRSADPSLNTLTGASVKKYGFFQSEAGIFQTIARDLGLLPQVGAQGHAWHRHPLAFLVEAADDICYKIMDLEDGYKLKLLPFEQIRALYLDVLGGCEPEKLGAITDEREKLSYLRALAINSLVRQAAAAFVTHLEGILSGTFDTPLLDVVPSREVIAHIDRVSMDQIYAYRKVVEIESAGFEVISGLLDAFLHAVFHPRSHRNRKIAQLIPSQYLVAESIGKADRYAVIMNLVQFVAGMTDPFALATYRTIKGISLPTY